jgi:DNA-binding NtrC family response regulator
MEDWTDLLRRGRLLEAQRLLERSATRSLPAKDRVNEAELLYLIGRENDAARLALDAAALNAPLGVRAKAAAIRASCAYDAGMYEESIRESQLAVELAENAKEWGVATVAVAHLIERRSLANLFDDAIPLVPLARKYTLRSGEPQAIAHLHIIFARVEGRAGHFDRALRHVQIGRLLLEREPNLLLDASSDLAEGSILSLLGDYDAAYKVVQTAKRKATESGWSKGCAVAAANLANFSIFLGRFDEAEKFLAEAPASFVNHATYVVAVAETRSQSAISRGDFEAARRLLSDLPYRDAPNLAWYALSCRLTEARVLLALKRWDEALRCAADGLKLTEQAPFHPARAGLRFCHTQAQIGLGDAFRPMDLECEVEDPTVALLAASRHAKAVALAATNGERARLQQDSAQRLASFCGSTDVIAGVDIDRRNSGSTSCLRQTSPNLDSAVTLLDLAGHPHVLGREALAVLDGAECTDALALVATGAGAPRLIEQRRWNERDVVRAVEQRPEGVEILPVGRYRDELWQIVARPKTDIDPCCTFAAIRRLLAAAVALDQYRRDEKQRSALWPADALEGDPDSIWASEQMAETVAVARRIAPTSMSVLLTGETGTGKEMLARAIHRASDRADKPFLPFNCTAVPRDMLESQLFGYKKGAFTGADTSFVGVIRAAAGGTLFLDEIADVNLEVQPKLLRFLETHEIHPLGEPHPITVDVRVIAATNAALERLVSEGRFREDLFYRLNVVRLQLPPLRERREEIPPLVYHYLRRYGDEQRKGRLTISDETLEYLLLFSWPGNIRQLANEIRRIVAMVEPDTTITPAMLSPDIQASRRTIPAVSAPDAEVRLPLDQPLPVAMQLLEQVMVRRALERSHGRVEEASRILGISRKGLFLKRRRLGLRPAS